MATEAGPPGRPIPLHGGSNVAARRGPTRVMAGLCSILVLALAIPAAADNPNPAPVPLFTAIQPFYPLPPGAHQAWRIEFNHEQIRQPAAAIQVDIPGLPAFVAALDFWSPREGYIDAPNPKHPTGLQQIPHPLAPPEAFSWHWYAPNALSLTVHQGIVAGTVVRGARWFYISPRPNYTLLYEPSGSVGPPPVAPPRPVPSQRLIGLAILALGLALSGVSVCGSGRRRNRGSGRPSFGAAGR